MRTEYSKDVMKWDVIGTRANKEVVCRQYKRKGMGESALLFY